MSTRLTYTSGAAAPETDAAFEAALEAVRCGPAEPLPHVVARRARRSTARRSSAATRAARDARRQPRARGARQGWSPRPSSARGPRSPRWRRTAVAERCAALRRAGAAIAERHMEMAAAVTLETGKSRTESIAEVQEAVDLIEAYCEQIESHGGFEVALGQLTPEETNQSVLRPFGVFGVIGPFNFPVALVTRHGRRRARRRQHRRDQAVRADAAARARWSARRSPPRGCPRASSALVHGGAATGRALAEGAIDGVVFTGSAEVGRALGRRFQEGPYARPAITEMGGKNPAIVAGERRPRRGGGRHRLLRLRLLGPEVQRLLARDRARLRPRRAGRAAGRARGRARRRRPGRPRRVHRPGDRRARGRALRGGGRGRRARRRGRGRRQRCSTCRATSSRRPSSPACRPGTGSRATSCSCRSSPSPASTRSTRRWPRRTRSTTGSTAGVFSADDAELARFLDEIEAGVVYVNRRAGATTGAWPGFQSFCGWKSSGSTGKGGLGPVLRAAVHARAEPDRSAALRSSGSSVISSSRVARRARRAAAPGARSRRRTGCASCARWRTSASRAACSSAVVRASSARAGSERR